MKHRKSTGGCEFQILEKRELMSGTTFNSNIAMSYPNLSGTTMLSMKSFPTQGTITGVNSVPKAMAAPSLGFDTKLDLTTA